MYLKTIRVIKVLGFACDPPISDFAWIFAVIEVVNTLRSFERSELERKLSYNGLISQTIAIERHEIIIRMTNEPKPELICFLPTSPQLFRVFASRKCVNKKRPFSMLSEAQTVFRFLHKKRSLSQQNAFIRLTQVN